MSGARAAIRYAKALLSLATDQKNAKTVSTDMALISKTITDNEALSDVLQSPVVPSATKKAILSKVFTKANTTTTTTHNLIDTLITNKRINILGQVATKYNQLFDESKGVQLATVTTAIALTPTLKEKVLAKAKDLTGKKVEIKNNIDESILGGFILRVGDVQYDASVANQLNKLKREFTLN